MGMNALSCEANAYINTYQRNDIGTGEHIEQEWEASVASRVRNDSASPMDETNADGDASHSE